MNSRFVWLIAVCLAIAAVSSAGAEDPNEPVVEPNEPPVVVEPNEPPVVVEPNEPVVLEMQDPSPADGAINRRIDTQLSWKAGDMAVSHNVYLGTSQEDVAAGAESVFQGNQAETTFDPNGDLAYGTTYFWRVDEVDSNDLIAVGAVLSFTTRLEGSDMASDESPSDGATGQPDLPVLSWTAGVEAVEHVVYLSTDQAAVTDSKAGALQAQITDTFFMPAAALQWNKTYYWRVDEVDAAGYVVPGMVWSFTVADYVVVADGPMTLEYDNTVEPYVTEMIQEFVTPQDWTKNGVNSLQLEIKGQPSEIPDVNDANDVIVVLADDGDPNDANDVLAEVTDPNAVPDGVTDPNAAPDDVVDPNALPGDVTDPNAAPDGVIDPNALPEDVTEPNAVPEDVNDIDEEPVHVPPVTNDPAPLYVAVTDSSGKTAVVPHPGNPDLVTTPDWTMWKIRTSSFSGVNMKEITSFIVGVGDGLPGGVGVIQIANVRVVKPIQVNVENASFEKPGVADKWYGPPARVVGFENVPGWSTAKTPACSGVALGNKPSAGSWSAYLWGGDSPIYQTTGHTIVEGEAFQLDVDACVVLGAINQKVKSFRMSLYYEDGAARVPVASTSVFTPGDQRTHTLKFSSADARDAVGHNIGIELANVAKDNMLSVDNVRLRVR